MNFLFLFFYYERKKEAKILILTSGRKLSCNGERWRRLFYFPLAFQMKSQTKNFNYLYYKPNHAFL